MKKARRGDCRAGGPESRWGGLRGILPIDQAGGNVVYVRVDIVPGVGAGGSGNHITGGGFGVRVIPQELSVQEKTETGSLSLTDREGPHRGTVKPHG